MNVLRLEDQGVTLNDDLIKKNIKKETNFCLAQRFKPIFHCNAKPPALSAAPNMLVSKKPHGATVSPLARNASPNAVVEYSLHWPRKGLICVGHVHFMLFVHIFSRRVRELYLTRTWFSVEYGLVSNN